MQVSERLCSKGKAVDDEINSVSNCALLYTH